MFVRQAEYIRLRETVAAQSATISALQMLVNKLETENATLKADRLGIAPVRVPQIERADPAARITATPKVPGRIPDSPPEISDLLAGNLSFEDMGDDEARRSGVDWDPVTGHVAYR